jgi:tetratricopeptide (TPR) repeat protein
MFLRKKEDVDEIAAAGSDSEIESAAKARLSTLTGVSFEDSQDDLQEAMPKTAPPVTAQAAAPGAPGGIQVDGEAVLTQYTSGDGQGVEEMERMLAKDPENLQLLDWLAFMYYSNNETEKAIDTYGRIITLDSSNAAQHYYLANSYYKANRVEEAVETWRKVCELKPDGKLARKAKKRIDKVEAALG